MLGRLLGCVEVEAFAKRVSECLEGFPVLWLGGWRER
jgi:hypothetical protein